MSRSVDHGGVLGAAQRSGGAITVEVPTIAVEPPRSPATMERAIKGLVTGRYLWVAFTSTNAVKAVREKLEDFGLDARAFAGVKVAAVGEATAAALVEFGIKPELVPSGEQNPEGLLRESAAYDAVFDPIDRVVLPRAALATATPAPPPLRAAPPPWHPAPPPRRARRLGRPRRPRPRTGAPRSSISRTRSLCATTT